ncbi:ribbon-helix-helix domain-containing protein [Azospirillum argentinense]
MNDEMLTAPGNDDRDGTGKKANRRRSEPSQRVGKTQSPMMKAALGQVDRGVALTPGRSIRIGGRRTTIRLQDALWDALLEISKRERQGVDSLCTEAARKRPAGLSVSAAIRLFITQYFREAANDDPLETEAPGTDVPFDRTRVGKDWNGR